jgi:hypothetical protein
MIKRLVLFAPLFLAAASSVPFSGQAITHFTIR